jgi:hypothetical protein
MRALHIALAASLALATAACAYPDGQRPQPRAPVSQVATPRPVAPTAVPDSRFATLPSDFLVAVHTGFDDATFVLEGPCTFAELLTGRRVYLIWPEGHVDYDGTTGVVRYTDLGDGQVVEFTSGQVLDIRAVLGSQDQGYRPIDRSSFVMPPDPSCPDDDVALVTGVSLDEPGP